MRHGGKLQTRIGRVITPDRFKQNDKDEETASVILGREEATNV